MARKVNYVNNKDFYKALVEYRAACEAAEADGKERPIVPNYIGDCFMQIAKRLALKPNFSGYPYIEDMKTDGIENALRYIMSFNPDKGDNPFAYFTRVIWNAFIRRITLEKKQLYIRYKASQVSLMLDNTFSQGQGGDVHLTVEGGSEYASYIDRYIEDYEKAQAEKADKVKERTELAKQKKNEELIADISEDENDNK